MGQQRRVGAASGVDSVVAELSEGGEGLGQAPIPRRTTTTQSVILSEAKNLDRDTTIARSRSFASLRMTEMYRQQGYESLQNLKYLAIAVALLTATAASAEPAFPGEPSAVDAPCQGRASSAESGSETWLDSFGFRVIRGTMKKPSPTARGPCARAFGPGR